MATRPWVAAAAAAALNPQLLALRSCSPVQSVSPAQRSSATGLRLRSRRPCPGKFVCRRAKNAGYEDYKFPDPIPEFAEQETSKFREHMAWRLEQKKEDYFGDHVEEIVDICTEVTRITSLEMAPASHSLLQRRTAADRVNTCPDCKRVLFTVHMENGAGDLKDHGVRDSESMLVPRRPADGLAVGWVHAIQRA